MSIKAPNSGFHHFLPYIVFLGCLALGAGATLLFLNQRQHAPAPTTITPPKKSEPTNTKQDEVVLSYLLPEKSTLATVGGDTPLQAVIYGRELDLPEDPTDDRLRRRRKRPGCRCNSHPLA
jgi:hypothetical protein